MEWELNEWENGWFYIDHPATSKRLRITNQDVINVENDNQQYDNLRFRFISPAVPITLTEKQTLPYFEGFENGIGSWRQFYDDDYDWELGTGGTPTAAAGPSRASFGENYLFAEGHDTFKENAVTNVESHFDFSTATNPELRFHYHMHGFYIDYLAVDIHDGTAWTNDVWRMDRGQQTNQDDPWRNAVVGLSAYAGNPDVTVRFRTATTRFNAADPAIDNITIQESTDPTPDLPKGLENTLAIGVNFVTSAGLGDTLTLDPTTLAGALDVIQENWNNTELLTGNSGNTSRIASPIADTLVDSEGTRSPAQISFTMNNPWSGANTATPYGSLMSGYLDTNANNDASVSFTQIPYPEYDIHVYIGSNGNNGRNGQITDGTTTYSFDAISNEGLTGSSYVQTLETSNTTFPDANYAVFSGKTDSSFTVTYLRGSGNGGIHGIQIVPTGTIIELTPYQQWAETFFEGAPAGTDTSETGNPDGDTFTNIQEWAFVTDPLTADSPIVAQYVDGDQFIIEYKRRNVNDPTIRAAWSVDLDPDNWRIEGGGLTETMLGTDGDIESMSASIPMDTVRKFIRLEVRQAAE